MKCYLTVFILCGIAVTIQAFDIVNLILSTEAKDTVTLQPNEAIRFIRQRNELLALRVDEIGLYKTLVVDDGRDNSVRFIFHRNLDAVTLTRSSEHGYSIETEVVLPYKLTLTRRRVTVYSANAKLSYASYHSNAVMCHPHEVIDKESKHTGVTYDCSHDLVPPSGEELCNVQLTCPGNYTQNRTAYQCISSEDDKRYWNGSAYCEPDPQIMESCLSSEVDLDDDQLCDFSAQEMLLYMKRHHGDELGILPQNLGRSTNCRKKATKAFFNNCNRFCRTNGTKKITTCRGLGRKCVLCAGKRGYNCKPPVDVCNAVFAG